MTGIVNKSAVKRITEGYDVSEGFLERLEREVRGKVKSSQLRASENGRSTLMERDV